MNGFSRDQYRVAIVGAGVVGLFTAYYILQAGGGPVLLVDRRFLSGGASGRNGGGVRQQWESSATVRLAQESVAAYRRFGTEFGYNVWFRQGGYLFLAETELELDRLRTVQRVARESGLPARLLDADGIRGVAPVLERRGLAGGTFLHSDGTLYPFPAVFGLYERVCALGAEVAFGVDAHGVRGEGGRVRGLVTDRGDVGATTVVNAAGGWSAEFAARSGVPIPNTPTRHEILATEPLKPFLDPMVVRLRDGLYFSQTMRGEIVGGLTMKHPPGTDGGMSSSTAFLRAFARAIVGLVPALGSLRVLRAWSGFYDDTPDGLPIVGEDPRLAGFVQANGFGGHGFMLAPATSRRAAAAALGERVDLDPGLFGPGRFLGAERRRPVEGLSLG
ncbi:MAG TPA: FAD-binding oxidoreductase [Thermoplasmata archaeon]|nr:FAD-binding oxidoreductase [Thermoplasmata archaeon]